MFFLFYYVKIFSKSIVLKLYLINTIKKYIFRKYQIFYNYYAFFKKSEKGMKFFMNKELKQEIKNDVEQIINSIEYEEYMFNKVFHSNIQFQKSYYKFNTIYEKYGKEAYKKYVPKKYKTQELQNLIQEQNFVEIYEHYGLETLNKLKNTADLENLKLSTTNKLKLLFIKISKLFSLNTLQLPSPTLLALPENILRFEAAHLNNDNESETFLK